MTEYYADVNGSYLGGFDGAEPPAGATKVDEPPQHANQKWNGLIWEALPLTARELKLHGVEFEGVMCSATKNDMWGLNSVESWVVAGNSVPFEFDNGNKLTLTTDNYQAFKAVWIPFRASFFS